MPDLVLGPVLRYVDESQATVWVETDAPCRVEILGHEAQTFTVEDHHYALVAITGLERGTSTPYQVALDGRQAWPPPGAGDDQPPSVIRTLAPGEGLDLVFGSCREVAPHHAPFALPEGDDPDAHGIDALRALAIELMDDTARRRPDALLMLGDQLYADEPPRQLTKALRDRGSRPDGEARATSFADYALLYRASWSDPAVRWMLSTVPSMMIFDDHEILDEWKISDAWVRMREHDPGYRDRVASGLMAYWVYQHLGNLTPQEISGHPLLERLLEPGDGGPALRAFAEQADRQVGQSRWSFARDFGPVRLLVLDSRASRRLDPGHRRILDDAEWEWARRTALEGRGAEHLLLASSLPFLLPAGLHHLEAALEKLADGALGARAAWAAERVRWGLNLGHWASFQASFAKLIALLDEVSAGDPGDRPASVLMLSGDVHHGYLTRLPAPSPGPRAPVWQVVCSPFRKRLARHERAAIRLGGSAFVGRLATGLSRGLRAQSTQVDWSLQRRASYANQVGLLRLDGRRARVQLLTPEGSSWQAPRLRPLWEHELA